MQYKIKCYKCKTEFIFDSDDVSKPLRAVHELFAEANLPKLCKKCKRAKEYR